MRLLESVVIAVELVALLLLLARRHIPDWSRHAAVALLPATALAQLLAEGYRWQMVPAYALATLLVIAWLVQRHRPHPDTRPRRWRTVAWATGGTLGLVLVTAPPVLVPVFDFPLPTGPHAIGTVTYHWQDQQRPEVFTDDPDDHREVVVQVWYPARPDPEADRAPYVPDSEVLDSLAELGGLPAFTFDHLKYVRTNAVTGAPVADENAAYPLLILATGRGGFRQYNTLGVEELVSHGYIVAGIDHPYSDAGVVFPDGRVARLDPRMTDDQFVDGIVPFLAGDANFTLQRLDQINRHDPLGILTAHVDTDRVGLFGLSLGGMITAHACMDNPRFRACLPIDCWMTDPVVHTGLTQPTMWLTRDADTMRDEGWTPTEIDRTHSTIRTVFNRLPTDGYLVRIPGMYHADFGDTQLLSPLFRPLGLTGPLDATTAHHLVNGYVLAFFDHHLRDRPAPLLDRTVPPPGVLFNHHPPPPAATAPR